MAQKPLRGINFPGLEDTYIVLKADDTLSTTSTNPIQNKAVAQRLSELTEAFSEAIENIMEQLPALDTTLSEAGKAADAGAVGAALNSLLERLPVAITQSDYDKLVADDAVNEKTPYLIIEGEEK